MDRVLVPLVLPSEQSRTPPTHSAQARQVTRAVLVAPVLLILHTPKGAAHGHVSQVRADRSRRGCHPKPDDDLPIRDCERAIRQPESHGIDRLRGVYLLDAESRVARIVPKRR